MKKQVIKLPETACPSCHLITRADWPLCIHCQKPLPNRVVYFKKKSAA